MTDPNHRPDTDEDLSNPNSLPDGPGGAGDDVLHEDSDAGSEGVGIGVRSTPDTFEPEEPAK